LVLGGFPSTKGVADPVSEETLAMAEILELERERERTGLYHIMKKRNTPHTAAASGLYVKYWPWTVAALFP